MGKRTTLELRKVGMIIRHAKKLAREYQRLTGRPLGITGEVGEYEAARLLGLSLCDARQPGFDATRKLGRSVDRIEIKSRLVLPNAKPGQRMGTIKLNQPWDKVLLVLLDEDFEPQAIHEAARSDVQRELRRPGSIARNKRGQLAVSKFRKIAHQVWP